MNENLEIITYSITFVPHLFPKNNDEMVMATDQDNPFKDIANTFTLQLLLENYDKKDQIKITETTKNLFPNNLNQRIFSK